MKDSPRARDRHPFPQLLQSMEYSLDFLRRHLQKIDARAAASSLALESVIELATVQLTGTTVKSGVTSPCFCDDDGEALWNQERHEFTESEYDALADTCKRMVRCYRTDTSRPSHVLLRKRYSTRSIRLFLKENGLKKIDTESRQSLLSILGVLVSIMNDPAEHPGSRRSLHLFAAVHRFRLRRFLRRQIHAQVQPILRNTEFIRFPDRLGSHHQWRLCHSLEAFLRVSRVRGFPFISRTPVICDPLVQNAVDKITSWQIRRPGTEDRGAFRSGDSGQAAIGVTIAALFALLRFDRIVRQETANARVHDGVERVAVVPVPQKILSIKIPAPFQKFGLRGPIEMDQSGAWAAVAFTGVCLLLSLGMHPKPDKASESEDMTTTTTISRTVVTPTTNSGSSGNYTMVADKIGLDSPHAWLVVSMLLGIGSPIIVGISRSCARSRFRRIVNDSGSGDPGGSVVDLGTMRSRFANSTAAAVVGLHQNNELTPDLAATALSELVKAGYFEHDGDGRSPTHVDILRVLSGSLFDQKHHGGEVPVAYSNNVDKAVQLLALLDLFTLVSRGHHAATLDGLGIDESRCIEVALRRIRELVKSQEEGDARTGGWRINEKDSRASVFATAQVLRVLSRIADSPDKHDRRFSRLLQDHRPIMHVGGRRLITMEAIKDSVASAVTYLRADLLEKLDREAKVWSQGTGTRTEIYRIALPLAALSERASYRGKHGADEVEIRASVEWLQTVVLDQVCPDHEDQVLQRPVTTSLKYESFVHRHMVSRCAVEGILLGESSLETSFLQSQLGPSRTSGRPITSRLFHASVQRCILAVQHLLEFSPNITPERSKDLVDALAMTNRCCRHTEHDLTAGQIWIEYCRTARFVSGRPLPVAHWLPRSPRDLSTSAKPVLAAMQFNGSARFLLFWSVVLGLLSTEALSRIFDGGGISKLEWNAMMAFASAPLLIPLAAVFQFVTKPKTIGSSLRWSAAVIASQFFSFGGLLR